MYFPGTKLFSIDLANPKSEIFTIPSCNSKLAGLISLWMIYFLFKSLNPSQMCLKNKHDSLSERFFLALMYSLRSPSWQYSKKIYKLLFVLATSYSLTIYLLWVSFYKMEISLLIRSRYLAESEIAWIGMTLQATYLESSFVKNPLYTFPKAPSPSKLLTTTNLSTFLFVQFSPI